MHPLVAPALGVLCVNVSPRRYAPAIFLLLALTSLGSRAACNFMLLGLFTGHVVDTVNRLQTGTAPALVFAALAPLNAAFDVGLLRSAIQAVRAVALVGAVIETLFARKRLMVTANNVAVMALAAYTPAEVAVSFLILTTAIPGALLLSIADRGGSATAARVLCLWGLFEALAAHEMGYELCISMAVAISL